MIVATDLRRRVKRALLGLLSIVVLIVALVFAEFVLMRGETPPIEGEHAVASLETVELGGVPQWILVRGRDRRSPVVLWLHGGPGMPSMYLAHAFQQPLEEDFVVVHWDRLGAGKSYGAAGDRMVSVRSRLDDTFELTRLLRERFERDRIYLLGHSWGSYLGLLAAGERPEYYRAFVGTGVVAGTREEAGRYRRAWLEGEAAAAGDSSLLARLTAGEPIRESDVFRYGGGLRGAESFWPLLRTGLGAPEYTLFDALNVRAGVQLVHERMEYDVTPTMLEGEVETLEVPVAFFLGRNDYTTPSVAAADYLERLEAPLKRLVWFERSAHFPFMSEPQRFADELAVFHRTLEEGSIPEPAPEVGEPQR